MWMRKTARSKPVRGYEASWKKHSSYGWVVRLWADERARRLRVGHVLSVAIPVSKNTGETERDELHPKARRKQPEHQVRLVERVIVKRVRVLETDGRASLCEIIE